MSNLIIFTFGLALLVFVSIFQPMRGWLSDLLSQRYMLLCILPIFVLFGWPIDDFESYRTGNDLGWQRVARVILFTSFFGLTAISILYRRSFIFPRSSVFVIFALYILFAAASAVYSSEPLQSLWKAFELLVLLMFAAGLYARQIPNPENNVIAVTNALLYLVFSLCLMSLAGGFLAPELAWRDFGLTGFGVRSMSGVVPMVNPNTLGQLGGIVALAGIFRLLTLTGTRTGKTGDWIVLGVGFLTVYLAYSRTSIFASVLLFVLLLFLLRRHDLLLLAVPAVLLVWTLFLDDILEYMARGQDEEQFASMSGRTHMWEAALDAWQQSPLLGHGFFVGHKNVQISNGKFLETADSTYIETLVNLGIVGFSLIAAFAIGTLHLAWKVFKKSRDGRRDMLPTTIVLFIFVGFIVARSFTASSFQVLHYNLIFLMVAIVSLQIIERRM